MSNELLNGIEYWLREKRYSNGGSWDRERIDHVEDNFQKSFDRAVDDGVRELINAGELKVTV